MNGSALHHLTAIRLAGPDARAFAQSQLTRDLLAQQGSHWQVAAWCEANGHTITTMLIQCGEERVDCVVPTEQLESIVRRLRPFSIGRQVTIEHPLTVMGLEQPDNDHALALDLTRGFSISPGVGASKNPTATKRWRARDIALGLPWLGTTTEGRFLPQALGLERLDGVSYTKGCYPGQEVIAKIHYRGQCKQRLVRVRTQSSRAALVPHQPLYLSTEPSSSMSSPRIMGWTLDAVDDQGLAVIHIRTQEQDVLTQNLAEPHPIQIEPLGDIAPASPV